MRVNAYPASPEEIEIRMSQIVRRKAGDFVGPKPEILAPAGNKESFLAAVAAGADAVYCGLKTFSARMAAQNFSIEELIPLADLARSRGAKLYLAANTLLKPGELQPLCEQLQLVQRYVKPQALIVQDLAVGEIAKQIGFKGEIHLSTLANVTVTRMLKRLPKTFGVQRVVLPRELDIEEMKLMAAACPKDLFLETFVHGALCYSVSGRCYWSSFLGGKSGLRGRCVQPCRRRYQQGHQKHRSFSCQDLSLDVLVKALAGVPKIKAWKIEGRKKGPHYVYYTTTAYKMLRDEGHDAQAKKVAVQLLEQALGRQGTHYHLLPQRPQNPVDTEAPSGSGQMAGTVRGAHNKPYIEPRLDLMAKDKLRIGYEDDPWHQTLVISKAVPKRGQYFFKLFRGKRPANGSPVFLIDRREPGIVKELEQLENQLAVVEKPVTPKSGFKLRLPPASPKKLHLWLMHVRRNPGQRMRKTSPGLWAKFEQLEHVQAQDAKHTWWWLPPVIWPAQEEQWQEHITKLLHKGARRFVLNAPWQMAFFRRSSGLNLWAGPFCNIANPLAIRGFKMMGGQGVIVSPELGKTDLEALAAKSVLPLGLVVSGFWPLCVSRVPGDRIQTDQPFISPKGEQGWVREYNDLYWVYPNWQVDLRAVQGQLQKAGYRMFIHLDEPVPKAVKIKKRPGLWNYDLGLS
jgi:putative protease